MGSKVFDNELRDNLISIVRLYHSYIYFGGEDNGHKHYR